MARRKLTKNQKTFIVVLVVLIVLVLVSAILYLHFTGKLNPIIDDIKNQVNDSISSGGGTSSKPNNNTHHGASFGTIDGVPIKAHFFFIGQGDAIILELPMNEYMLVDAGSTYSDDKGKTKSDYYAYLDEVVEGNTIDHLVVTHPDQDHYNLMSKVVDDYQIKNFYLNEYTGKNSVNYNKFVDKAKAEQGANLEHIITSPDNSCFEINIGECNLTFYSAGNDGFSSYDKNGMSILILLKYGGRQLFLTGDATDKEEQWFLNEYVTPENEDSFDVDFLKVAHHGSRDSSIAPFLNLVKPEYSIISVDEKNNPYNHPTQEALDRITAVGSEIYRTDEKGTIVLTIDSDGDYLFNFER